MATLASQLIVLQPRSGASYSIATRLLAKRLLARCLNTVPALGRWCLSRLLRWGWFLWCLGAAPCSASAPRELCAAPLAASCAADAAVARSAFELQAVGPQAVELLAAELQALELQPRMLSAPRPALRCQTPRLHPGFQACSGARSFPLQFSHSC